MNLKFPVIGKFPQKGAYEMDKPSLDKEYDIHRQKYNTL